MAKDVFPDREAVGEALPLRIAKMTDTVVREEMLALPEEPSPVGPIELLRIWRSIETLVGKAHAAPAEAGSKLRPTLLAEIEALEVRLGQLDMLLETVQKAIRGPVAVVRRLVDDYETSRMQLQFAKDMADALRNGALLRDADVAGERNLSAAVKRLTEVVQGAQSYECPADWLASALANPATKSMATADRPVAVDSFPIPSCAGPLTDASRRNTQR
jgi:hypothetical protein